MDVIDGNGAVSTGNNKKEKMAKSAYVFYNTAGQTTTTATYSVDIGGAGNPTFNLADIETLISLGYEAKREVPLLSGGVVLVMEAPEPRFGLFGRLAAAFSGRRTLQPN